MTRTKGEENGMGGVGRGIDDVKNIIWRLRARKLTKANK
jgi:hypothetical protein